MRLGRRTLLGGLTASLGGCGFQPVYMPSAGGTPGVAERELSTIFVALIPDRPGQLLRQALQQRFEGADGPAKPRYTLTVAYWISGEGIGIQADTTVTRVRLFANANWTLVGRDPAQTHVTNGFARVEDAVNIIDEQYFAADLQTEAAYQFLAQATAKQISTRLAIFFRQKASA